MFIYLGVNFQQLQYLLAVDQYRHFARAAEACCVTQPTLSMMIHKLEDELELKIFDRSRQPVCPTEGGLKILAQVRTILKEVERLQELAYEIRDYLGGKLHVGIIPTLAPYLLPLFVQSFHEKYPDVELKIAELLTGQILEKLRNGDIDLGILVAPENEHGLVEIGLFNEPFVVYSPKVFNKEYLLAEDIDPDELLLLEEGHCFRSQIIRFCELRKEAKNAVEYTSGSLETLRNLADKQLGITILPELATLNFTQEQHDRVKQFASPRPMRHVSLVMPKGYMKQKLIDRLATEIMENIPKRFKEQQGKVILF